MLSRTHAASDYLERLDFYRAKNWNCELTGKGNLTYRQALASEASARQRISSFPETHRKLVVKMVHHST